MGTRLPQEIHTMQAEVKGEEVARDLMMLLFSRSSWFEVMPLPDDWWRINYKHENDEEVRAFLRRRIDYEIA